MKISAPRKFIVTGAAAIGVMLGAAGVTAAATNSDSSNQASEQADSSPSYTSSITTTEGATLDGLAKITSQQANAAAVTATGGTSGKVELENENGNVVFGVEITQADGTKLDVKVDAGNGAVLAKEADGDRNSANDTKDAPESDHGSDGPDAKD